MRLNIDRRFWLRGQEDSSLLDDESQCRCCLGHLARACGVPDDAMRDVPSPGHLAQHGWLLPGETLAWTVNPAEFYDGPVAQIIGDSLDASEAMTFNDNVPMLEEIREAEIITIFARHGITLTFFDGFANRDETSWDDG